MGTKKKNDVSHLRKTKNFINFIKKWNDVEKKKKNEKKSIGIIPIDNFVLFFFFLLNDNEY